MGSHWEKYAKHQGCLHVLAKQFDKREKVSMRQKNMLLGATVYEGVVVCLYGVNCNVSDVKNDDESSKIAIWDLFGISCAYYPTYTEKE